MHLSGRRYVSRATKQLAGPTGDFRRKKKACPICGYMRMVIKAV
jgi:hypothetical protein